MKHDLKLEDYLYEECMWKLDYSKRISDIYFSRGLVGIVWKAKRDIYPNRVDQREGLVYIIVEDVKEWLKTNNESWIKTIKT